MTAAARFPNVVENAGSGSVRHYHANGRETRPSNRANNRTRRNIRGMPYVVEDAPRNGRLIFHLPEEAPRGRIPLHLAEVAPVVGAPSALPYVVEAAPRGLPTTRGYGHLDYSKIEVGGGGKTLEEREIEITNMEDIVQGRPPPVSRKLRSFDDSGRYIVAHAVILPTRGMGGFGHEGYTILIDNHGQKHHQNFYKPGHFWFDNTKFPTPLPDVLIDQIKHMAYMLDEASGSFFKHSSWSPTDNIASLTAAR